MSDSDRLLPCPMCGGQPDFQHFNVTPNVRGRVICSCGIELRQGANDTEEDVRAVWNTRSDYAVQAGNERKVEQTDGLWPSEDSFAAHLLGVTARQDERIAALEALVRDMYRCIAHANEQDWFHFEKDVSGCGLSCTVNGENCGLASLANRMRELGIEVDYE